MPNDETNYSGERRYDGPSQQHPYGDPMLPSTQPFDPRPSDTKLPPPPPPPPPLKKPFNGWKAATQVLLIMVIILASAVALLVVTRPGPSTAAVQPKSTAQPPTPTSVSTATQPPTTTGTASLAPTTQLPPVSATSYSALQPGPSCDINGGTWTPQGLNNITCGTQVSASAPNIQGYLFLQLPNGKAFSQNNKIGIISNPSTPNGYLQCIGLDEQNANTGFLAEYCGDGHWSIYTISSDGTIVQTLAKNLTSTRTTADISLALKGTTLSFSIDNEVYPVNNISPIQPTKVAITYFTSSTGYSITINNFSYTVLPS